MNIPIDGIHYDVNDQGCWVWRRSVSGNGKYPHARIGGVTVIVHCFMYEEKFGKVPDGKELDHSCRNRRCINPDHVEAVTHIENVHRGWTARTGMDMARAREIRTLYAMGAKQSEIASRFKIDQTTVSLITRNRHWKET